MKPLLTLFLLGSAALADWPQFHGPGGQGTAATAVPTNWGEDENIAWKAALPGVGASSPVIAAGRVFVTASEGGASDVKRHVLCFDVATGKQLWDQTVESELPEQDRIREDHGYASATPVATATRLFVFFGKSGVFAFITAESSFGTPRSAPGSTAGAPPPPSRCTGNMSL